MHRAPGGPRSFARVLSMGYKAVRTERYKYIQYTDLEGMDELYDLEADPYEMNNVIDDPEAAQLLMDMQAELASLAGTDKLVVLSLALDSVKVVHTR